jgi:hypothetical protein
MARAKSLSSSTRCTAWLLARVYCRYGHIKQMADAEAEGVREAGLEVDMFQHDVQLS